MCSTLAPDCRCDSSFTKLIENLHCPNETFSGKLCVHKRTFQSLSRGKYHGAQCTSVCQVRNIPFEESTKSSFLKCEQEVYIFEEVQESFQDVIGDVYCPERFCADKSVSMSIHGKNVENCYEYLQCKACCHLSNFPFMDQTPTTILFGGNGT